MPNPLPRLARLALAGVLALGSSLSSLAQDLEGAIESLLNGSPINTTTFGIQIIDTRNHAILAELNASGSLIPASNMKLLTSVSALHVLGEDFAFRTEIHRSGSTIHIIGSGDPALADGELLARMNMEQGDIIDSWIEALRKTDLEGVDEIVLDDRIFDMMLVHPDWPTDQLNRWYCAQVSGLNYHTNTISVYSTPRAPGRAPTIETIPGAGWLRLANNGRSVNTGANTVWVSRKLGTNTMTLHGNVRWSTSAPIPVAIHEPALMLGRLVQDACEEAGLGAPQVRRARPNEDLPDGEIVAVVRTPMHVVLERCNVDSHNLYAESLFKRMGHDVTGQPGSWDTGAAVVRMAMGELLGPADASSVHIADGSGMSRQNRVSPEVMTHLLDNAWNSDDLRVPLVESLPIGGATGTLETRFRSVDLENTVRAKSGYLNGVSNLSGYVIDPQTQHAVAFSIMVNDIPSTLPIRRVKLFHEQVVRIIDEWLLEQRGALADVNSGQ
ncbi:MAG: D-alanyl-D-alanine carboxypeptidase/D-alanyl-D-alanine endopeptidase [Planctomycetota bacterium]|jgi:D-alanyl-D-alanine carboxypeptidase/D-alanyl-D-alanine-endopeptidase (penicillin-binding protein 4)